MRKLLFFFLAVLFLAPPVSAVTIPSVEVKPARIMQGEPALVTIHGLTSVSAVRSATWNGKPFGIFLYDSKPGGFIAADIGQRPGTYDVVVSLKDGTSLRAAVRVDERPKLEAPLGIPEKLGGNTTAAEQALLKALAQENAALAALKSGTKSYWTGGFRYPVRNPVVTDAYGYSRLTVGSVITHKGTDFRASLGTPVYSMNRGVVRYAKTTRAYGNMVVVDHGLGLMTLYLHLSKIKVNPGELVERGQLVGLAGDTGYAEAPHLHLSVKVNGISIDPMKFMALVGG